LDISGLHATIEHITKDTVAKAQQHLLLSDNKQIRKHVRRVCEELKRQLLGMRRSRDGYERAYNEFDSARNNYIRILDDWDASDAKRTRSWTAELQRNFKTLEKKLKELSAKSVHSVAKVFGVDAHGQSELIFANKQQADKFFDDVNKHITLSLSKFQGRLVHIVQELATRAQSQRLEALKVSIEETQDGVSESLADNVTPDSIAMGGRNTKFLFVVAFFGAMDVAEMGLTFFGPVGVLAALPLAVFCYYTRPSKTVKLKKATLIKDFDEKVVQTFFRSLKTEVEKAFDGALKTGAENIKTKVKADLAEEEARYQDERRKKEQPTDKRVAAETLACFINFQAAESA